MKRVLMVTRGTIIAGDKSLKMRDFVKSMTSEESVTMVSFDMFRGRDTGLMRGHKADVLIAPNNMTEEEWAIYNEVALPTILHDSSAVKIFY